MPQDPHSEMQQAPATHETRWSLVALAASPEDSSVNAMDELLQIYLPVLKGMLNRWPQLDESTKEDLLQSFVQKRILEKQLLSKADASKGRFRNFLFRSFQNHIVDECRKSANTKRSPGKENLVSYDEIQGGIGESSELEKAYNVSWVRNLLEEGCRRLEVECKQKDRMDLWVVFCERLKKPFLEGAVPMPYGELVELLDIESPSQASNLLVTSKRLLRKYLEDVIRETVNDPTEIQAEVQFLKKCLK